MWLFFQNNTLMLLSPFGTGDLGCCFKSQHPPLFPLLIALHSDMDKINQHRFSLAHLDRSEPVLSCLVQFSLIQSSCPIFRDSLVHWTWWLTYSLSCSTCMCASIGFLACCFVLGTPCLMLQKRLSSCYTELLKARLSDVTSRQCGTGIIQWGKRVKG